MCRCQNAGQIEAIKAAFEAEKGDPLAEIVESELSGDLEWAMLLRLKNPLEAKAWLLQTWKDDTVSVSQYSPGCRFLLAEARPCRRVAMAFA